MLVGPSFHSFWFSVLKFDQSFRGLQNHSKSERLTITLSCQLCNAGQINAQGIFSFYSYCYFVNILCNVAPFSSYVLTILACDKRMPFSACFAYITLLQYKGHVSVCAMRVWLSGMPLLTRAFFCTFTQHELGWRDCVQWMCRPRNWDVCASVYCEVPAKTIARFRRKK